MDTPLSIGIFLPPPEYFGESVVRGIGKYSAAHCAWRLTVTVGRDRNSVRRFLETCQGVIACADRFLTPLLARARCPVVAYFSEKSDLGSARIPRVTPDEEKIGEVGAEHLLSLGFRRFGFYGANVEFSQAREKGFVQRIAEAGYPCLTTAPHGAPGRQAAWERLDQPRFVRRWLKRLKPPAAVMGVNDINARQIVEACQRIGYSVPEDIAVLGVDNNELLCEYASVPLSSVGRNLERMGFEAAKVLDRLLHGQTLNQELFTVPPGPLVPRRSTAVLAINEPDAAAAVRFIQQEACNGIDVDDVLAVVPVSRRALERKLLKAIKRTPAQEIRRVRLARVCELLAGTDLPLSDIVPFSGFQSRTYLAKVFKDAFHQTPRQYRQNNSPAGYPQGTRE